MHLKNSYSIINILKKEFNNLTDIKFAFVIGSYNKKYFSILSDLDIIIILDNENLDTLYSLKLIRKKLKNKYSFEIDFMISNLFELQHKIPISELNDFVITNLNNDKYVILKNDLSEQLLIKNKLDSLILDSRYFFNKLRNLYFGDSFFVRDRCKKVISSEKTKIAVSALFNILRRYLIIKYNKYVEEYDTIMDIIKSESSTDYKLLFQLYMFKKNKCVIDNVHFERVYIYAKHKYEYITKEVMKIYD